MTNHLPEDEDARLGVLFQAAAAPIADDGFSQRVLARVAVGAARRRLVLGTTALVGVAIAAAPAWTLARWLGEALTANVGQFAALNTWATSPIVLAAAALVLVAWRALRWLEE
jgi:hypothetical protein